MTHEEGVMNQQWQTYEDGTSMNNFGMEYKFDFECHTSHTITHFDTATTLGSTRQTIPIRIIDRMTHPIPSMKIS